MNKVLILGSLACSIAIGPIAAEVTQKAASGQVTVAASDAIGGASTATMPTATMSRIH